MCIVTEGHRQVEGVNYSETFSPTAKMPTIWVVLVNAATWDWEIEHVDIVKCGKIVEVTLGTQDIKSRPTRYQKGLWLQLMCCTPFRLLSQDFGTRMMEDWRSEDQSGGSELFLE